MRDRALWPRIVKPSGPSTASATSQARTSSMPKWPSNRRTKGPMAQEELLFLALNSSSALRP